MILTKLEIIDWEPCLLKFVFVSERLPSAEFRHFVDGWLKGSARRAICQCEYRYSEFSTRFEESAEILKTEWMCTKCTKALADASERKFPNLKRVELGLRAEHERRASAAFIAIPAKEVELEDGSRVAVGSFLIARHAVTVGEFEKFARSTGYVTAAEQRLKAETYKNHCGLSGVSPSERMDMPVQFVTLADAEAFCRHVGCRLPTEAEWLAAAVLDTHEKELTPSEEFQLRTRPAAPNAFDEVSNWDFTATRLSDGRVVTRRGPFPFLIKGWREEPLLTFNRRLIAPNHFDMSITFRQVKGS